MIFDPPLLPGRLIRRYKRFLADIELDTGSIIIAHCANPGSMLGLADPGSRVWVSDSQNPKRKLRYSWELVETADGALVGIHTSRANALVEEGLHAGALKELQGFQTLRREVRYGGNSRIDFLLEQPDTAPIYLEVKSVTLSRTPGLAEFPDSKTARGTKHLHELAAMAAQGARAVMVFLAQRADCHRFAIAADIDPIYEGVFNKVRQAGVEAYCYHCTINTIDIRLEAALPFVLSNPPA